MRPEPVKVYRDEDKAVITGPAQVKGGPFSSSKIASKVLSKTTFDGIIRHQIPGRPDDYDIKKKLAREELDYHHSKVQDAPFSSMARSKHKRNVMGMINMPKELIGEDRVYPPKPEKSKS